VANLSGGEKSRLMLAKIIYEHPQILALDEPTNHLDIASREALENALVEYSGTILFVTHDRYLVQKIASHLIYIEDSSPHVFDRLTAFEEWLANPSKEVLPLSRSPQMNRPKTAAGMSKNRRDKLEREAAELEAEIANTEKNLKALEASFQNPNQQTNWEEVHRQYDDLKKTLDTLYLELNSRWEALGEAT
jgi:ATP-binding cassette subfamily F protein 3